MKRWKYCLTSFWYGVKFKSNSTLENVDFFNVHKFNWLEVMISLWNHKYFLNSYAPRILPGIFQTFNFHDTKRKPKQTHVVRRWKLNWNWFWFLTQIYRCSKPGYIGTNMQTILLHHLNFITNSWISSFDWFVQEGAHLVAAVERRKVWL